MPTSYSRRQGDYCYDVETHESAPPGRVNRFYAKVVNLIRLESGDRVPVNAHPHGAYGATPDEAFSRVEAVVEAWVKQHNADAGPATR